MEVLSEARDLGFLGPGSIELHLEHTDGFARAVSAAPSRVLDLGSGAGIPGLALASTWPESAISLLESSTRRAAFLERAVQRLDLGARVSVLNGRAELLGRDERLRGHFDAVVARSFGPPAAVAECGAPFLERGGILLVSEPPDDGPIRWPGPELDELGLRDEGVATADPRVRRLRQVRPCPQRFPRRTGVPTKRPLW